MPRKAFISYSHSDHQFADHLANKLNQSGVDLFFDKWDIAPGDSLVGKIFLEGLAECDLFLIALSQESVASKWVREELNTALVKRIEGLTVVVPLLVETCDIPLPLRGLRWIDMRQDIDHGVREIVKLVHGVNDRPPLGDVPEYVQQLQPAVGGLTQEATTIGLDILGRIDLDSGRVPQVSGQELADSTHLKPIEVSDAVEELESFGLVRLMKWLGTSPFSFGAARPTYALPRHFAQYLEYSPEQDVAVVVADLANYSQRSAGELREATGLSPGRLNRAIDFIEDYGLARVMKTLGSAPFTFNSVMSTRETRQAAKQL
ncbi:MAG: toll/interleukin-1 receptor domain-containing protein [Planctomycetota bacterium]